MNINLNCQENLLQNALSVCLDMFLQRGYIYFDDINYIAENEQGNKIVLFILSTGKLTIEQIKYYINQTNNHNLNHCIIIIGDSVTPIAKKYLFEIPNMHCELFYIKELQYNITKHKLVPKHIKLNPKQVNQLKNTNQIQSVKNLPILLITDPVSRFYDFRSGDIIRVERSDCICYRYVK